MRTTRRVMRARGWGWQSAGGGANKSVVWAGKSAHGKMNGSDNKDTKAKIHFHFSISIWQVPDDKDFALQGGLLFGPFLKFARVKLDSHGCGSTSKKTPGSTFSRQYHPLSPLPPSLFPHPPTPPSSFLLPFSRLPLSRFSHYPPPFPALPLTQ